MHKIQQSSHTDLKIHVVRMLAYLLFSSLMVMEAELSLPSGSPTSPRRTPKLLGFQEGGKCMHVL